MPKKTVRQILWKLRDCELKDKNCPPCNCDVNQALADIKSLLMEAIPQEIPVCWNEIDRPDDIARQSERYGYNTALAEIRKAIEAIMVTE